MARTEKPALPLLMLVRNENGLIDLVNPFPLIYWNSHYKKVGYQEGLHEAGELAKNFRMPSIEDAKLIRAGGWADFSAADLHALWERGYEMRGEDLVALAVDLE